MSARDELPPGWEYEESAGEWFAFHTETGASTMLRGSKQEAAKQAWLVVDITSEELATMRAAVERLKEAEGEIKVQGHMLNTQYLEAEDDRAKCEAWEERATKAEAALAEMKAQRDEARRMAEIRLRAIESIRHASMRATPTEGD